MARYEARYDDELGNMVYDTSKKYFLTADDIANILNDHDGMMTRFGEEKKKVEEIERSGKTITDRAIASFVLEHFKTILNGGTK